MNAGTAADPQLKSPTTKQWPDVNDLTIEDVLKSLTLGVSDFRQAPLFGLFFGSVYALGGLGIILMALYLDVPYLIYPLAMGFALIAPFAATGLYDVSRRLEQGEPLNWSSVLGSVFGASGRDIAWMALVTCFTLIIWLDIAALMFFGFFGLSQANPAELLHQVLTTIPGLIFLAIGNLVGAVIAATVFSYSVVSFPMLVDRDVDFVTAMVTSVRTVLRNPLPMLFWAFVITLALIASLLTGFLGLILALPILGHTSWHLYRRAVEPNPKTAPPT